MPGCHGPDRGSRFTLLRKASDLREMGLAPASIEFDEGRLEKAVPGQLSGLVPVIGRPDFISLANFSCHSQDKYCPGDTSATHEPFAMQVA